MKIYYSYIKGALIYCSLLLLLLFSGCQTCNRKQKVRISRVQLEDVKIKRYGKDLFNIDPEHVKEGMEVLSTDYRFFIGNNYDDTLNIIQIYEYITDPFLVRIAETCNQKYPSLDQIESQLTNAFKHYKYYFPEKLIPQVYTYISGVDFEYPVQYFDSIMIISIDDYLGKDFIPYKKLGIPGYRMKRMEREYIVPDCMKEITNKEFSPKRPGNRLIDHMINEGKKLYFLDLVLPEFPDTVKIGYTGNQLDWCYENEENLWVFLIENELLYSSDYQKIGKLINDGPFTSFLSRKSPGKLAVWLGWQIVRSYMDNNNVTLNELMVNKDPQNILNKSGYKP
jgi:hypothetical protein